MKNFNKNDFFIDPFWIFEVDLNKNFVCIFLRIVKKQDSL